MGCTTPPRPGCWPLGAHVPRSLPSPWSRSCRGGWRRAKDRRPFGAQSSEARRLSQSHRQPRALCARRSRVG